MEFNYEVSPCFKITISYNLTSVQRFLLFQYKYVDARIDSPFENMSQIINDTSGQVIGINERCTIMGRLNPNFFNLSVDTAKSAVHVPVPVYKLGSKNYIYCLELFLNIFLVHVNIEISFYFSCSCYIY